VAIVTDDGQPAVIEVRTHTADRCSTCGACCVGQLVVIRHDHGDDVPLALTDGIAMRQQLGRCIAFRGRVGHEARCSIYERRPVTCRALKPGSWACREIREAAGFVVREGSGEEVYP
jgi:Fe-S-cluster containining protein